MPFSYSGNPDHSSLDAVRFLIGDTDATDPLLQDAEITYMLSVTGGGHLVTAVRCVETIMARLARRCNERVGSVSIDFSQQMDGYAKLKAQLEMRIATSEAIPYAGGISRSDAEQVEQNSDRVKPDFTKHMMENDQIAPWVVNGNHDGEQEPDT